MPYHVDETLTGDLGSSVAEPFRTDPRFWRSVCASADAVLLLGLAVAASAVLHLAGTATGLAWLAFALPAVLLVRSAVLSSRFHRAHEPLPATLETARGEQSWRDAERAAVAAVFGRALVRSRH